jgi:hypothetical protein
MISILDSGYRVYELSKGDNQLLREAYHADALFDARLRHDAPAALASLGIAAPPTVTIRDLRNTDGTTSAYLILSSELELTEEELELVSGGGRNYPPPPSNACGCFSNCPPCA